MRSLFGFIPLVDETEALLVRELDLQPLRLESDLARADGTWKGEPVSLETRAYVGRHLRYARFARLVGPDIEIGNVLCLGQSRYPLPVFGADLVAIGRATAMLAADLSPMLPPGADREHQLRLLGELGLPPGGLPAGGVLPDWCASWFSAAGLHTRVPPELAADAGRAYMAYPRALCHLVSAAEPRPDRSDQLEAAQARYLALHRADDKGLQVLARMFGAAWADRYVGEVLFPDQAVSSAC